MGKGSKSSSGRRGNSSTANTLLPSPFVLHPNQLNLFEDRRFFNPDPLPSAASFSTPRHRLVVPSARAKQSARGSVPHQIGFQNPERVLICVRRKIRKEVLHAFKKTGKSGQKRPRRNDFSEIHCR